MRPDNTDHNPVSKSSGFETPNIILLPQWPLQIITMDFKNFGKNLTSLGAQITPFASRTFQYTKEQLGQAEDKVAFLPLAGWRRIIWRSMSDSSSTYRPNFLPTTSTLRSVSML
jgi:hypothetical protein